MLPTKHDLVVVRLNCFSFFQYAYTEEYEQQRGKGSFPAHLTPGYKVSKKATELASDVSRGYKKCTLMHTATDPSISVW